MIDAMQSGLFSFRGVAVVDPAVTDAEAIAEGGWLVDAMYRIRRIIAQ